MSRAEASAESRGFEHCAFFYRSGREYVEALRSYIDDGLLAGEPVMVAVPRFNLVLLRDALGSTATKVAMADMRQVGGNPGRILGVFSSFAAKYPDRRVRLIGECVWPGRSADEYAACVQHEASSNSVLDAYRVTGLCPYNASQLDEDTLADARATHPLLWQEGSLNLSAEYAPSNAFDRYNQPLPSKAGAATYIVREFADLSPVRSFIIRYGQRIGLPPGGIADLQLIATELATNSLEHTGGACRLALWQQQNYIVCEVSDSGRLDDQLAGRRPPTEDAAGGRGLFLINALADMVRTHASAAGTTVQAYLQLNSSGEMAP